jgi:hypothetical protein
MAAAGAVVAEALRAVADHARPGQSTTELDKVAADVLARHGARSPFLDYHPAWAPRPFPAVLCVSVNDAVVHGIPNGQVLADGDLVSHRLRRDTARVVRRRRPKFHRRHAASGRRRVDQSNRQRIGRRHRRGAPR